MNAFIPGRVPGEASVLFSEASVLYEVFDERLRQDEKWGEQNHPDGTGGTWRTLIADVIRKDCEEAAQRGDLTFRQILSEEVFEAYAESDPAKLRAELIQVAAVAVAWVEKIDRSDS